MVVVSGEATHNEKEIKTDWPVDEGLDLGTTKQVGKKFLLPEEKSLLSKNSRVGIY